MVFVVLKWNFVGYFSNLIGYVFFCLFVCFMSGFVFWFFGFFFLNFVNFDELNKFFFIIMFVYVLVIIMSIWFEEKR